MSKLRISECTQTGYSPLSMHEGWQVAYLTTCDKHNLDDLENMEVHEETDELFILLHGAAVLLTADYSSGKVFEAEALKTDVLYDVPKGVWHNIAMAPDTLMLIVEKDGTHLNDVRYIPFEEDDFQVVNDLVKNAILK